MTNIDDFQVKYWAGDNDFSSEEPEQKRSIKKKLLIVFSFIVILAITPALLFGLSNLKFDKPEEVSVATISPTPKVETVKVTEAKKEQINSAQVLNNDSYWKISKRVCGSGKYYLSIQAQNEGKALHKGDTVIVNCIL